MSLTPPSFYRWRPHPWHGLDAGDDAPKVVNAYIEITPFDTIKYEIDKATGYLRVDRPQRGSSQPPALYGFVPRTFCGHRVAALSAPGVKQADGDPIDICVISERAITRTEIVLRARVVGGIQMIDDEEADDKIVAVLESDLFWGSVQDINELPKALLDRLTHYFATYKLIPGVHTNVRIEKSYDRVHAEAVVLASMEDYAEAYADTPPTLRF
ncbi:MAG TPA: inorganic pyrophosphatase [Polyangiaceae bacterium]|nr:inorganic pyrophosphatase [Polyangiaceae bacterium]